MNNRCRLLVICPVVLLSLTLAGKAADFEKPPVLQASDLLEAEWLKSDLHEISPTVPVEGGIAKFTIRTNEDIQEVHGVELTRKRVREIHATAELDDKRLAGAAAKGLVNEGVDSAKTLGGALKAPGRTLMNIPKGFVSIAKRSAGSVENKVSASGNYTGGPLRDWFQVAEGKLELAAKLGVDPYTDYEPLQKELSRKAGVASTSGIGLRLIVPFDGIVAAAEQGELARELKDVYLTPPSQLFQENVKMLGDLGVSKERASQFLGSEVYTPADQSLVIRSLAAMGKPTGVEAFLDAAELVENRFQSFLFRRSTEWLRQHHDQGHPVAGLTGFGGFPAAVTKDHRFVLPVYVDHISWTELAPTLTARILEAQQEAGATGCDLLVPQSMSPRAKQELAALGFRLFPM